MSDMRYKISDITNQATDQIVKQANARLNSQLNITNCNKTNNAQYEAVIHNENSNNYNNKY